MNRRRIRNISKLASDVETTCNGYIVIREELPQLYAVEIWDSDGMIAEASSDRIINATIELCKIWQEKKMAVTIAQELRKANIVEKLRETPEPSNKIEVPGCNHLPCSNIASREKILEIKRIVNSVLTTDDFDVVIQEVSKVLS